MSEQLPIDPSHPTTNRNLRWPRLIANSLWIVIWFAIGSLVIDLVTSVWNHNFKADILSARVGWWLGKAVGVGLFFGLFIGFFIWLAEEIFGRSETNSSPRTGR